MGIQASYYWTVSAYDPYGGISTSPVQSLWLFLQNEPPQPVHFLPPFDGSPVVQTMSNSATVSWGQVTTPENDPIAYAVYLGDSPNSLQLVGQTNGVTLTLSGLSDYRAYYLQVVASNPYGASSASPIGTFSLAPANGFPKAYNYPNPFSPNRGGTHIVFNAPASGYAQATVSIYSELQDLLFQKDYLNIPPGISNVIFDGRDRYGRPLFNGSYICRVRFEGPDDKEIFYLLVVK